MISVGVLFTIQFSILGLLIIIKYEVEGWGCWAISVIATLACLTVTAIFSILFDFIF